jgi:hypothetical protein
MKGKKGMLRVGRGATFEVVIKRMLDQALRETHEHAAKLGHRGKDALASASRESSYWREDYADYDNTNTEDWRELPREVGSRVISLAALEYLSALLRGKNDGCEDGPLAWAATVDRMLMILRNEVSHAGPPPEREKYLEWSRQEEIKDRIEELEAELKLPARLGIRPTLFHEKYRNRIPKVAAIL